MQLANMNHKHPEIITTLITLGPQLAMRVANSVRQAMIADRSTSLPAWRSQNIVCTWDKVSPSWNSGPLGSIIWLFMVFPGIG
jgi:hypothetical protein